MAWRGDIKKEMGNGRILSQDDVQNAIERARALRERSRRAREAAGRSRAESRDTHPPALQKRIEVANVDHSGYGVLVTFRDGSTSYFSAGFLYEQRERRPNKFLGNDPGPIRLEADWR